MIKKIVIVLLVSCCMFTTYSQSYIPTLVEENNWKVWQNFGMGGSINYSYVVQCDTFINDVSYKMALSLKSSSVLGFYRENIDSGKIYKWDEDIQEEVLIIDYSLELGDTMVITGNSLTVDSIRSLELYGLNRKVIYFNELQYFIEGIGYSFSGVHNFGGYQKITDFVEIEGGCLLTSIDNSQNKKISIFPNPTSGFIKIEQHEFTDTKGVIYNELGQTVKVIDITKEIDMSELKAGIYFLRINGLRKFFKIVKI